MVLKVKKQTEMSKPAEWTYASLHRNLDLATALFIAEEGADMMTRLPSKTPILELIKWLNEKAKEESEHGLHMR